MLGKIRTAYTMLAKKKTNEHMTKLCITLDVAMMNTTLQIIIDKDASI